MIIRLTKANFSANNIGELNKFTIYCHGTGLADAEFTSPVEKGSTATIKVTLNSGFSTSDIQVTMKGNPITPSISSTGTNEYTITIPNVTGKIVVLVGDVVSGGEEEPVGNIAYYAINKNIYSDGKLVVGNGRIAITNYFETNGAELSVTASFNNTTSAKRYYQADKSTMASGAATSVYGRVVFLISDGTAIAEDVYAGETITVNGTKYTLQNDPEYIS